MSSLNLHKIRARFNGAVSAHAGAARFAAATAALTSAALPKATRAIGKPVAGLNTSWACPLLDALTWPLMKCEIKGNAAFVIRVPLRMIQMNQG